MEIKWWKDNASQKVLRYSLSNIELQIAALLKGTPGWDHCTTDFLKHWAANNVENEHICGKSEGTKTLKDKVTQRPLDKENEARKL